MIFRTMAKGQIRAKFRHFWDELITFHLDLYKHFSETEKVDLSSIWFEPLECDPW